jgi:hypothetical protein
VAKVDVGDDSIRRFVVHHYRYDAERHERRHVLVAAFDNRREFKACMAAIRADIERREAAGEPVDRHEHSTGRTRRFVDRGHNWVDCSAAERKPPLWT